MFLGGWSPLDDEDWTTTIGVKVGTGLWVGAFERVTSHQNTVPCECLEVGVSSCPAPVTTCGDLEGATGEATAPLEVGCWAVMAEDRS